MSVAHLLGMPSDGVGPGALWVAPAHDEPLPSAPPTLDVRPAMVSANLAPPAAAWWFGVWMSGVSLALVGAMGWSLSSALGGWVWVGVSPVVAALWYFVRRLGHQRRRSCALSTDAEGVTVELVVGGRRAPTHIPWAQLRAVEVVTDKRGSLALKLSGEHESSYFAGRQCRRWELEWVAAWLAQVAACARRPSSSPRVSDHE